jgi:hypothetical protein
MYYELVEYKKLEQKISDPGHFNVPGRDVIKLSNN